MSVPAMKDPPAPTVAVVEGPCVGGGLILAAVCDVRISTPDARFGMPIARTVGHGLSVANHARLVAHFGPARTLAMILLAELLDAGEAREAGFVHRVVAPDALEEHAAGTCRRIAGHAPLTLRVTREAVRRVMARSRPGEDEELLRAVYGSEDFRRGVRAFLERTRPVWEGR